MRYAAIKPNDATNGRGINVSFWVQGCPFHCEGCHNPETWDFNGGLLENKEDIINKIIKLISANGIIRNFSVLGGEPLCESNRVDVCDIIEAVRTQYPNILIYLWTGYNYENLLQENNEYINKIFSNINYLIDGNFQLDKKDITLKLRGSSNQNIIKFDNNKNL